MIQLNLIKQDKLSQLKLSQSTLRYLKKKNENWKIEEMGSKGTFVSYYYYYNSYYAFLAASAPQLLSFTRQTDKALSSPRFLLSHLHRKLYSLSLSRFADSETNLLFSFSHQGREKEICNRWCWTQLATAGLNKA